MEPEGQVESSNPPRRIPRHRGPRKLRADPPKPYPGRTEHAGGVRAQPHRDSYFLPGKVVGRAVIFLLNSGCTTNLLSRRVFEALPRQNRSKVRPYTGEHGTLADGSCIPLDKSGRPLVGGVQVVRNCTIPGRFRATIHCRVNNNRIFRLGVVEGTHERIQLASSLNQLTARGEILVQCVNPFTESVKLPAGSMLSRFHPVQEEDARLSLGDATEGPPAPSKRAGDCSTTHQGVV